MAERALAKINENELGTIHANLKAKGSLMFNRNGDGWMLAEANFHLDWILTQLKTIEPLSSRAELVWFTRMEGYAADGRAALANALESGQTQKGLELAVLMARYWWVLGQRSEGRAWLMAFLAEAHHQLPDLEEQAHRWLVKLAGEDDPV